MSVDFTEIVRPGDTVVWTQGAGEPIGLVERLLEQRHAIGPFRVFLAGSYSASVRPEHADVVSIVGLGAVGANRALCDAGVMEIVPTHVSALPRLLTSGSLRPDVVLLGLGPEDGDRAFGVGATHGFATAAVSVARTVVAEVNAAAPRTASRATVPRAALDVIVHVDRPLVEVAEREPTDVERRLAAHVAELVDDGAVLQLGIGGVPRAVAEAVADRRDLGLHSGVLGDAAMGLIRAGAVTNATKSIDAGRSVANALVGSSELYAFADRNTELLLEPASYTHAQETLARLRGLVAVNSAIEVDLTGQIGAEVAGGRYRGTVGGHADFVRGALAAPGGRSIVGLPSRSGKGHPRVVARFAAGTVTTSRADADVFVTEHGIAELRGQPLAQRVRQMIAIAHPDDREALERAAAEEVIGLPRAVPSAHG
jgi:acyl-CoA hydrolase